MNESLSNLSWPVVQQQAQSVWNQAVEIWIAGGWAMPAIAMVALIMFATGVHIFFSLRSTGFKSVPERKWRRWFHEPALRRGPIGELITAATAASTLAESSAVFNEIRCTQLSVVARDLRVMKVCIAAAPLLGLLGTVTGMLTTFQALATGSGGEKTMSQIANGIREALITTETGLVVALPGLFFQYQMARTAERFKTYLAQLETVSHQLIFRSKRAQVSAAA